MASRGDTTAKGRLLKGGGGSIKDNAQVDCTRKSHQKPPELGRFGRNDRGPFNEVERKGGPEHVFQGRTKRGGTFVELGARCPLDSVGYRSPVRRIGVRVHPFEGKWLRRNGWPDKPWNL